jgi:anthranilate 1,2-dioxygenase large subunit
MAANEEATRLPYRWPSEDPCVVPYAVYVRDDVFRAERERIYQGPIWHYVALEVEIPKAGDFVTTYVGTTPVIVNRADDGDVYAFVNRCAHRGAQVVRERCGNSPNHTCIYHRWTYTHKGDLRGVPYREGLNGLGGFPKDFDLKEHGLRKLKTRTLHGIVFATFAADAPPLETFLGKPITDRVARMFAKKVRVIGYQRQRVRANWKFMVENVKDAYHGALLHAFNAKFGFFRSTQRGDVTVCGNGVHSILTTYSTVDERAAAAFKGISNIKAQLELEDKTMLRPMPEFDDGIVTSIISIFPSFLFLHAVNFIGFRHVRPKSPREFEMVWTYLGYADDTPELADARLRQLNLFGAGGYVSMEDAHAMEIAQSALDGEGGEGAGVVALGGRGTQSDDHLVTEVAIRGLWKGYRELMGMSP